MKFTWCKGTYEGSAVIEERHPRRPSLRVWPDGWKHGIWISGDEVVTDGASPDV